ncbi:polyadenylate-binding protein 1-like 2 [Triplophysa dalaica]|uniref:polyadenylate-binding protein 1-like 2 n=1 Tax=Triplophysa dalaica TaxID=1582913 RepID=UPI0024DFEBC2|nr:polyadenylate-binding protein 1-like 2 [Triplophysa dalaica]
MMHRQFQGQMTSFVGGSYCAACVPRDQIASLFVGDLHPEVSEFILHQTFSPFGPIQSVRVCRDRVTRRSLRYGYVNFVNLANAESAMDNLMCQELLGRPMRIMFSQRDSTVRTTGVGNIFVKGQASSIHGACLHESFSLFGKILSCKVVCDANGSKGYGFVHFATFEAAEKAIKALDGMLLDDQLVSIGHFKTFEERRVDVQVMAQDNERRYPVRVSAHPCHSSCGMPVILGLRACWSLRCSWNTGSVLMHLISLRDYRIPLRGSIKVIE